MGLNSLIPDNPPTYLRESLLKKKGKVTNKQRIWDKYKKTDFLLIFVML